MNSQSPLSPCASIATTLESTSWPVEIGESLLEQFALLMNVLIEANREHNLTAYRTPPEIAMNHFADSIAPVASSAVSAQLARARKAVDIGSGAGFPLLPLALLYPNCRWVAVEAVAKKCRFIEKAAAELGMKNVEARHIRAEDLARTPERETFDIATARAVGPSVSLCEVGLPLLSNEGSLLLYKTVKGESEIDGASTTIRQLGGVLAGTHRYRFPGDEHERVVFDIRKVAPTPDRYPRSPGMPFKRPLR